NDDLHASASAVAVLESHEIVQLRGGCLEDIAVHHRLDLVNELGGDVHRLAGPERAFLQPVARLGPEHQLAPEHMHRLVLAIVVLETQDVPGAHVEELADVAIGAGPDQLVAPGLVDTIRDLWHAASDDGWKRDAEI